jgi:WXG100 family type VII secretion target
VTSVMSMNTDTGLMLKTEGDVDAVADRLTGNLNSLMDQLAPLYDQWKGAGAGSFQQVRERFDQDMARLNVALRAIAEAVGSAGKDYDVSDEEIRADMDGAGATAGQITAALKL